jgi:transketolase
LTWCWAAGFALADRLQGRTGARVFAVLSDGELEEGQVWEAALFAGQHRLGSLTVLLDANDSQVDGHVSSITTLEPVAAKVGELRLGRLRRGRT